MHINKKHDLTLPSGFPGFVRLFDEVHVEDNGEWTSYPGQDNTNAHVSTLEACRIMMGHMAGLR